MSRDLNKENLSVPDKNQNPDLTMHRNVTLTTELLDDLWRAEPYWVFM